MSNPPALAQNNTVVLSECVDRSGSSGLPRSSFSQLVAICDRMGNFVKPPPSAGAGINGVPLGSTHKLDCSRRFIQVTPQGEDAKPCKQAIMMKLDFPL
eukprot:1989206-Amphidinium_carterae.1